MEHAFTTREKMLIDTKELAKLLTLSPQKARAFCVANGVNPVNVSRTAGRPTWRWRVDRVIAMLDTLEPEGQAEEFVPRESSSFCVWGRSPKDLFRELSIYKETA